jgi:hypothetical protein
MPDTAAPEREAQLAKALVWYTSAPQNLTITPINYPIPSEDDPRSGVCSCGDRYTVDENGVLVKPETKEAGIGVCTSAGKHPVRKSYLMDPSNQATTPAQAKELWADQAWNIGIVHGQTTSLVVFDIDVRADGLASMTKLTEALTEFAPDWNLSETLTYFTSGKSGRGYHMHYRADRDDVELWREIRALGENVLPGIEIKWKSGIVVAAPSLHASGQVYQLHKPIAIQDLDRTRIGQLRSAIARANGKAVPRAAAPVSASGGWGRMAQDAEDYRLTTGGIYGDLTWESAPTDAEGNEGFWSRQLSYFLMTGAPAQKFGPGHHHDSLKSLIGALAKIVFAKDSFCQEVAATASSRSKSDPYWLPAIYGSTVFELDAAVTMPKPWQITDRANLLGIARYAMTQELRAHGVEI